MTEIEAMQYVVEDEIPDITILLWIIDEVRQKDDVEIISRLPEKIIRAIFQIIADVDYFGSYTTIGSGGTRDHAPAVRLAIPIFRQWQSVFCKFELVDFDIDDFNSELSLLINEAVNHIKKCKNLDVICVEYSLRDHYYEFKSVIDIISYEGLNKESNILHEKAEQLRLRNKNDRAARCETRARDVSSMNATSILAENIIFHGIEFSIVKNHDSLNKLWPILCSRKYSLDLDNAINNMIEANYLNFSGDWCVNGSEFRFMGENYTVVKLQLKA